MHKTHPPPYTHTQTRMIKLNYSLALCYVYAIAIIITGLDVIQKLNSPGIYRDKIIAEKLIYIPNDDTQNYPFFRLQLKLKRL